VIKAKPYTWGDLADVQFLDGDMNRLIATVARVTELEGRLVLAEEALLAKHELHGAQSLLNQLRDELTELSALHGFPHARDYYKNYDSSITALLGRRK